MCHSAYMSKSSLINKKCIKSDMEACGTMPKNIISQRLNYYDLSKMRDK